MSGSIWEEIVSKIDDLVLSSIDTEIENPTSIIEVHDQLIELVESISESPSPALAKIAQKAAELSMKITLQEASNAEHALNTIIEAISTLQCMAREILQGNSPDHVPIPDGIGLTSEELFSAKPIPNNETETPAVSETILARSQQETLDNVSVDALEKEASQINQSPLAASEEEAPVKDTVWDKIVNEIDSLVLDAVEIEESDLSQVIKMHDQLIELVESISETEHLALAKISQKVAELSMKIALQETDDSEFVLNIVIEAISTLQCMAREILQGNSPNHVPIPDGLELTSEELFSSESSNENSSSSISSSSISSSSISSSSISSMSMDASSEESQFDIGSLTLSHISDFLSEMDDLISRAESDLLSIEKQPSNSDLIHSLFSTFHTMKGNAGLLKMKDLIALAHETETLLEELKLLPKPLIHILFETVDVFKAYNQILRNYLKTKKFQDLPSTSKLLKSLKGYSSDASSDVSYAPQEVKKAIDNFFSNESSPNAGYSGVAEPETYRDGSKGPQRKRDFIPMGPQTSNQDMVKIKTNYMDMLLDAIGELGIAQTILENDSEMTQIENIQTLHKVSSIGKITKRLQELVISMRMVTMQSTFQAMERIIRDLAYQQGKQIEVQLVGEDTEIDRNIINALYNSLVHIVRNAVDHGIETSELRFENGKREKGLIRLKASLQSGNVLIEVQDDGLGLSKEAILQTAQQKGLIPPNAPATNEVLNNIIFHPGFSTAAQLTEISGRGLGLDVVKKTVEELHGHIEVTSEKNYGSTFHITLPITLAILDGMLVRIGTQRYIIKLAEIEEFIQLDMKNMPELPNGIKIFNLRNDVIPVFPLAKFLRVTSDSSSENLTKGVIVRWKDNRYCFLVDELLEQQRVVTKSLGSDFNKLVGISGATILGEGQIGLIIDIPNILSKAVRTMQKERKKTSSKKS